MKPFLIICLCFATSILLYLRSLSLAKIIFCDIGQGAATLLQIGEEQILIDTGPDQRVLGCIGNHIPFFDHTLDVVVISHNQKDHNGGLPALYNKYKIGKVIGPDPKPAYVSDSQFIEVKSMIKIDLQRIQLYVNKASQSSKNINDSANVVTIKTPFQTIFLSSDINGVELKGLVPRETTILEVPHHGSKYGLYPDSLDLAHPALAVISVGKKNTYGHPSKEALDLLKAKKIPIWRTDRQGELVINL